MRRFDEMSTEATQEAIDYARQQGERDRIVGRPRRTIFEFPEEQRAYDEAFDKHER
jgi:hypothetical protein